MINHQGCVSKKIRSTVRRSLDYHGIARRALEADLLTPVGYDTDIDLSAAIVAPDVAYPHDCITIDHKGHAYKKSDWASRIVFPLYDMYTATTVSIGDVKRRRFSIIDRVVQKAFDEINIEQDAMFKAWDALGNYAKKL